MNKTFILFKGRHEMPAEVADAPEMFSEGTDPMAFNDMLNVAKAKIAGADGVTLYVTGLTPATVAVINACLAARCGLVLMHYNRATGTYVPQQVLI